MKMDLLSRQPNDIVAIQMGTSCKGLLAYLLILLTLFASFPRRSEAYSFLTHDDMVDVAWIGSIRPLLLARFPTATEDQLQRARSYVYGGATIQDMGYYPFGHQFFSNLTHYVRSGEFVDNLFRDSQTLNEYAFAIGALAHYVGDNNGHRYATNPSTPIEFPPLGKRYGPVVTYDQAPHAHIRTEFAYDVEQLSQQQFAPPGYLKLVGFYVPRHLLERAFFQTYGLPLRNVLGRPRPAIQSYRSSVKGLLPKVARAEVLIHHNDFPREDDTPAFHQFIARQAKAATDDRWSRFSRKPGFEVRVIAIVIRILPKIGPISCLAIRGPNAETNRWYIESMNRSTDRYEELLKQLTKDPRKSLELPDRDLDTGNLVQPGSYPLTDKTYVQLLAMLTKQPGRSVPAGLRQNILDYFSNPDAPVTTQKNAKAWKRVQAELIVLRVFLGVNLFVRHGLEKITHFSQMAGHFPDPIHIGSHWSLVYALISDGICSLLVVLGLGTRVAAGIVAINVIVVFCLVQHYPFAGGHGELLLLYIGGFLALIFLGGGRFSLDGRFWGRS